MKRQITLEVDGRRCVVTVHREGTTIVVERDGERHELVVVEDRAAADRGPAAPTPVTPTPRSVAAPAAPSSGSGDVRAPMVGVVREIHVSAGDRVTEGDLLITMEAMKMDIYVNAHLSGTVSAIHCKPGDTTTDGAPVATISPGGADAS